MGLLTSYEFSGELIDAIAHASKRIVVLSAYIKLEALDYIFGEIPQDVEVCIAARWDKGDLISGASDLDVYRYCAERGWRFGVDSSLHGKVYLIDDCQIFIGSANLTKRGMAISSSWNFEFGTRMTAKNADLIKLEQFISSEIVWLSDELFELINNEITLAEHDNNLLDIPRCWSEEIAAQINKPVEFLWTHELLFKSPGQLLISDLNDKELAHDFDLLNLDIDSLSHENIRSSFLRTRFYRWLCYQLKNVSTMSFGALSKALHDSLLDDPRPYRKHVKQFVAIAFEWAEYLHGDFEVIPHKHTKSLARKIQ